MKLKDIIEVLAEQTITTIICNRYDGKLNGNAFVISLNKPICEAVIHDHYLNCNVSFIHTVGEILVITILDKEEVKDGLETTTRSESEAKGN